MSVVVKSVRRRSPAHKAGIRPGDTVVSINGERVCDVLDYRFHADGQHCEFKYERGKAYGTAVIDCTSDPGLQFDTYLMDKQRHCKNKCIFCFIDQMPGGMRESLYFKDDDSRLSFLFGNYITLTNLTENETERIIKMHISPVNISVHTTNPALRVKMMRNKNAGNALEIMDRFNEAGIRMNCQIVVCPGVNDGAELVRTLTDLSRMDSVDCVSVVPVGLTCHRKGLTPLSCHDSASAAAVIDIVDSFYNGKVRRFYAADEFYLQAGREIPDASFYGEFLQLENGVGLWALLKNEAILALDEVKPPRRTRSVGIVTGVAAAPLMRNIVDRANEKWHNLNTVVYPIVNDRFGHSITVAGLLTGQDIINQLKDKALPRELLLPSCMLREGKGLFLDDLSVKDIKKALGINKITVVAQTGSALINALAGRKTKKRRK